MDGPNPVRTLERLAAEARAMVGVRFRHQGRDPERGVDCLGLIVCALERAGWPEARCMDETDYPHTPPPDRLLAGLKRHATMIPSGRDLSGCPDGAIVLMRIGGANTHMGIADSHDGNARFLVHAYAPAKRVVREMWRSSDRILIAAFVPRGV